ncbi:MmcQ/YjbR family DNA-binding protein [Lacticaseibacillus baoqingensis]|uniref:MmcQ/YjbR family DNA-binding protein n=1 Tax=Lacticaseibacillus baoqingensis TaxID=2486013 RepID=A0ABW4E5L2_9LACO|nr:MmcQ/YjbR family DNA-binding protein [Lacticaseibacillus baoqingensis]
MSIQDDIFKHRQPDAAKLKHFGFTYDQAQWRYQTPLVQGFELVVTIKDDTVTTTVIDQESGLPYVLHLDPANSGMFVGQIRGAYVATLEAIAKDCFVPTMFTTGQMDAMIDAIGKKYDEHPEFLWANFPNNAIIRRSDNRKWYALLVKVSADKLGLDGTDAVDVLVARADPAVVTARLAAKTALPAYHMNKKHWLSYQLDHGTPLETLMGYVKDSRELAK